MTDADDPRVGDLLATGADDARVVLIGFPSDEGVRRNGGRPGAAAGPAAIRAVLRRLTPDVANAPAFSALLARTADLGDVPVTGDLEQDQAALGELVAAQLADGRFVIVLGGGHETAYGHFLGYARAGRPTAILNWDAHADVRPPPDGRGHSGSPFRQALEHPGGGCRGYSVAGLLPHAVAVAHLEIVGASGRAVPRAALHDAAAVDAVYAALDGPTFVSFDLDAVDQASAPGVSAPATGGLSVELWLHAASAAGASPLVTSADVVELCPPFDRDGQTARLAALTVWHLLRGLGRRL